MKPMIEVHDVSMRFRMANDQIRSLKEYAVQLLRGKTSFRLFEALKHVSFTVEKGEIVGLVGSNGAGKSTILKIISNIMKPTEGTVIARADIVPMLELGSGFDYDMTGRENIFLNGAILGYSEAFLNSKADDIIAFSELGPFIDTPLRNYSSGMVARLAFSIATVVDPEILIVDEVLSVGDAAFQEKSYYRMLDLMRGGTTVLLVTHSMPHIRFLCDRVLWLDHGEVKMYGPAEEVCDAYEAFFAVNEENQHSESDGSSHE